MLSYAQRLFTGSTDSEIVAKFLKRHLLVGKKVLYKFPNYIASKLSHLHAVNR